MNNLEQNVDLNSHSNTFKYLYRDSNTGKVIITDYNNNEHETDIFGRKLVYFLPNISGMLSGINRSKLILKMNNSKSVNDISENNELNFISSRKSLYHKYNPGIKKIDGYSFMPKPISVPFYNEDKSLLSNRTKEKLNDNLRKYYSNNNNKIKKNNNFRLSYLNKDLNSNQVKIKDENKLMSVISKGIEELKEESRIKLNSIEKNPNYIALNRLRKKILENNKKSVYLKFEEAPMEIKENYNILENVIKNRLNVLKKKQNIIETKEKQYLNELIKKKKSSSLFDIQKKKYNLKDLIIGPDNLNNICQSKDFSIGRTIKMDFGNEKQENKNTSEINNNVNNNNIKTESIQNTKLSNILPKISKRLNSGNNSSNIYQDTDTAETYTHLNRNNSEIALGRNKSTDELSFLSRENEKNEIKKKGKNNLRSLKLVKNDAEIEKELLKGIKIESPKENNEIQTTQIKAILKTEGQLYKENMELLKKTNRKQYEIQKHKDEYDLFLLKKKLGNRKKLKLVQNSN